MQGETGERRLGRIQSAGTNLAAERIIWQGVDHVLRRMREPTHLWRAVLHEMREADCAERSGVSFCNRPSYGTSRQACGSVWPEPRGVPWAGAPHLSPPAHPLDA